MSFNTRLKEIIENDYTSQVQFANELGVSKAVITKYLNTVRKPNFEVLLKIGNLGYNLNWLITGKGSRKKEYLNLELFDIYDKSLLNSIAIKVGGRNSVNETENKRRKTPKELSNYVLEYIYYHNIADSLLREITLNRSFSSIKNILNLDYNADDIIFNNLMPAIDAYLKHEKLFNDDKFLNLINDLDIGDQLEFALSLSEIYVLYTEIIELEKRMNELGVREFGGGKDIYKQIYDLMRNSSYLSVKANKFENVIAKTFNIDYYS